MNQASDLILPDIISDWDWRLYTACRDLPSFATARWRIEQSAFVLLVTQATLSDFGLVVDIAINLGHQESRSADGLGRGMPADARFANPRRRTSFLVNGM